MWCSHCPTGWQSLEVPPHGGHPSWRSPFMETAACEDNKNSGLLENISKPAVPNMVHRLPPPKTSATSSTSSPQNFAKNA